MSETRRCRCSAPSSNTAKMTSQQGRPLSPTQPSALAAPPSAPSESHAASLSAISTTSSSALPSAGNANATSSHLNAQLPPLNTGDPSDPSLPRFHIRNPSAAGLSLNTDVLFMKAAERLARDPNDDGSEGDTLRHSATAPIAIHEGYLRSTFSAGSMTGSLSPGSALSSPALNALVDLTPLPSPLVMSDSPGSWTRGGVSFRPRSRGASGSSRDDSFAMFGRGGTLSPSPSLKKKGYQKLKTAGEQAVDASMQTHHKNEANRERNRSVSEFRPDTMHNIGSRHVTISNVAPESSQPDTTFESRLHREAYLAAQRGLVPATVPAGLPTPPASNRSVTESEEDEVAEDGKTEYIAVRQGPQMVKKLWRPVRQLGQGTFSKVWLATSEKRPAKDPLDEATLDPRKLVAIKVVEHGPAGGADEERVELSLKREVEMLRSVSHPSLVHLRAFDNGESQALLVLTYCPGGDLFDVASTNREILGVDLVQRIFAELVSATRYLHDKLIVHRDIKLESKIHWSVCPKQQKTNSSQMSCSTFPFPQFLC